MQLKGLLGRGYRPIVMVAGVVAAILIGSQVLSNTAFADASITINPARGLAGTNVKVTGSGFSAQSAISITFDGGVMDTRPNIITTNGEGSFDATFWIPFSAEDGTYMVVAKDFGPSKSSASTTFEVSDGSSPPSADPQSISVKSGDAMAILLKARDPDGDTLIFSIVEQPGHGKITGFDANSGRLTFVPDNGYSGSDSFTFKASDGKLESAVAKVSIDIIQADTSPLMQDTSLEVQEDDSLAITMTADDSDSSTLSFSILTAPEHGLLGELRPAGQMATSVTYSPEPDFNGIDHFIASVTDGSNTDTATFTITVTSVQDAPVAHDGLSYTPVGAAVAVLLEGYDPDGDPLNFIIGSTPAHGSLTGTAPNFTYQPDTDYSGTDVIVFKVNDGTADSNLATYSITVEGTAAAPTEPVPEVVETPTQPEPVQEQPVAAPAEEQPVEPVVETPVTPEIPPVPVVETPAPTQGSTDTVPPRLILPSSNLMFEAQSQDGTIVTYNIAAIDDHDGQVAVDCYPASGHKFPIGKVNVICSASDASGNKVLEGFVVDVRTAGTTKETPVAPKLESSGVDLTTLLPLAIAIIGSAVYVGYKVGKRTKASSSQAQRSI